MARNAAHMPLHPDVPMPTHVGRPEQARRITALLERLGKGAEAPTGRS